MNETYEFHVAAKQPEGVNWGSGTVFIMDYISQEEMQHIATAIANCQEVYGVEVYRNTHSSTKVY